MPYEFTQSPEIDAYNDTLSKFRQAPGMHVGFLPQADYRIKAVLDRYDDFVTMASFTSSEGAETMVCTCSARGMTVLIHGTSDDTEIGIRAMEPEQLTQLCEFLTETGCVFITV